MLIRCVWALLAAALSLGASLGAAEGGCSRSILVAPFENITASKALVSYDAVVPTSAGQSESTATVVDARRGVSLTATATRPIPRTVTVDRYSEAPRGLLEDILAQQPGLTVVERQRVDAMLQEQQFSGFTNPNEALALGRVVGARYLATGTVQDIATSQSTFNGYGVSTRHIKVTASVRVRVIDIETGQIVASTSAQGQESFASDHFGGVTNGDVAYKVIASAVARIGADQAFLDRIRSQAGSAGDSTAVTFEPTPTGADILVDDSFVGNAPITLPLPLGKPVRISIQAAGFQPWERSVTPRNGLRIAPILAPVSSSTRPTTASH